MYSLMTIFASVETLVHAPVNRATDVAAGVLERHLEHKRPEIRLALRTLDEQLQRKPAERRQLTRRLFTEHVGVRPDFVDVKLDRSMLAHFLAVTELLSYSNDARALSAARTAESAYWQEMHNSACLYDDVADFITRTLPAAIIPIAQTDACIDRDTRRYDVLDAIVAAPIVFELQPPYTAEAWDDPAICMSAEERRKAVFVGCSVDDMRAAVAAGCRRRILVDRMGTFTSPPEGATDLVPSLHDAADLLSA